MEDLNDPADLEDELMRMSRMDPLVGMCRTVVAAEREADRKLSSASSAAEQ